MRTRPDSAGSQEPWTSRLRRTPSRIAKQSQASHLPSPKHTHHSSTYGTSFPSSSSRPRQAASTSKVSFLKDRLAPPPVKKALITPVGKGSRPATKKTSKPSVAPFFQRVEAAFQNSPRIIPNTIHVKAAPTKPARSPSSEADDLIQALREHYLNNATSLHKQATTRLAQAQADLSRELTRTLRAQDEAFLAQVETQIKKLSQPLEGFRIQFPTRLNPGDKGKKPQTFEVRTVRELVQEAESELAKFEADMGRLWKEWAVAETEVKKLLGGVGTAIPLLGIVPGEVGGDAALDVEGAEMLKRLTEAIEREIATAEEDVLQLGDEAVALMKQIEKDFRKATKSDLQIFFQAIDEL